MTLKTNWRDIITFQQRPLLPFLAPSNQLPRAASSPPLPLPKSTQSIQFSLISWHHASVWRDVCDDPSGGRRPIPPSTLPLPFPIREFPDGDRLFTVDWIDRSMVPLVTSEPCLRCAIKNIRLDAMQQNELCRRLRGYEYGIQWNIEEKKTLALLRSSYSSKFHTDCFCKPLPRSLRLSMAAFTSTHIEISEKTSEFLVTFSRVASNP